MAIARVIEHLLTMHSTPRLMSAFKGSAPADALLTLVQKYRKNIIPILFPTQLQGDWFSIAMRHAPNNGRDLHTMIETYRNRLKKSKFWAYGVLIPAAELCAPDNQTWLYKLVCQVIYQ